MDVMPSVCVLFINGADEKGCDSHRSYMVDNTTGVKRMTSRPCCKKSARVETEGSGDAASWLVGPVVGVGVGHDMLGDGGRGREVAQLNITLSSWRAGGRFFYYKRVAQQPAMRFPDRFFC